MLDAPGHRVTIAPDETIVPGIRPSIGPDAILSDGGVPSSCEQFLLHAKQISKAIVIERQSSGTLDHGDVRPFPPPSEERALSLPITSSRRLREHPIDGIGIAPELPPSLPGDDLVRLCQRILERRK